MNELNNAYIITPNSLLASCVPDAKPVAANSKNEIEKIKNRKIKKSKSRNFEKFKKTKARIVGCRRCNCVDAIEVLSSNLCG
jgi:hypothetical protein